MELFCLFVFVLMSLLFTVFTVFVVLLSSLLFAEGFTLLFMLSTISLTRTRGTTSSV